jgi:hypothetical protein
MKVFSRLALTMCGFASTGVALAQPAPWWRWQSKLDSKRIECAQNSLGEGWIRYDGPYKDAKCTIRARVFKAHAKTSK